MDKPLAEQEVKRLRTELHRVAESRRGQRERAERAEAAIEATWRPEVEALRGRILRLEQELREVKIMAGHRWCEETIWKLKQEVAQLEALPRASMDQRAAEALQALQEVTGSNNRDTPWLGVVSAVVLLKDDIEQLRTELRGYGRQHESERYPRQFLAPGE